MNDITVQDKCLLIAVLWFSYKIYEVFVPVLYLKIFCFTHSINEFPYNFGRTTINMDNISISVMKLEFVVCSE